MPHLPMHPETLRVALGTDRCDGVEAIRGAASR
jgi:hypothetical protein